MQTVELGPVSQDDQTQRPFDLFLIFAGANIVATTLQVGATLARPLGFRPAMWIVAGGGIGGALLVAALAPLGPRLRVPSIIACRAALGFSGAHALAWLLVVTNFGWIALNNVIAASICATLAGGPTSVPWWAVGLGVLATVIVAGGPRFVGHTDRIAVPLLVVSGAVITVACFRARLPVETAGGGSPSDWMRGLDVTAGYQVSWLLMFADYTRYVRSPRRAGVAVFLGLAVTALWFMPLGFVAARVAGSDDPGTMIAALGVGWWGALLISVATLTTNFVNIYMSALALKSLRPAMADQTSVWTIGGLGAALSVLSTVWIARFADFTLLLAGLLVPVGGILLAHNFILRRAIAIPDLYDRVGRYTRHRGWSIPGAAAWAIGAVVFYAAGSLGGVLPSLVASIVVYVLSSLRESAIAEPSTTDRRYR
ncbi:MAG TPA: cytosine permease [Vicinamibacterales bacterium]|nr:cytosine permease [Vicinamibacterales bacterium]